MSLIVPFSSSLLVLTDTAFAFLENKFFVHVKQATP